jgi:hypothetical protein
VTGADRNYPQTRADVLREAAYRIEGFHLNEYNRQIVALLREWADEAAP